MRYIFWMQRQNLLLGKDTIRQGILSPVPQNFRMPMLDNMTL